ncbi:MAG TPA: hypothetical protein VGI12_20730 [Vicinamibacterales bacterium]
MNIPRAVATRSIAGSVVVIVLVFGLQAVTSQANPTLESAQRHFYNGNYDLAAAVTQRLCEARPDDLDACELRTASLLFQIKKALRETGARDKTTAWNACAACPALMSTFLAETGRGQTLARARLKIHPDDEETLFFLGKVDLNDVWLQLGTLGRKTGWDEYWEARRSLDHALRLNPAHVRARVARAWVDYIVGTSVPRGVRWLLGGGNKERGLRAVREVVTRGGGDFFVRTEATFALWDMQVREHEVSGAVATARTLALDFPDNAELRKFLTDHDRTTGMTISAAPRRVIAAVASDPGSDAGLAARRVR